MNQDITQISALPKRCTESFIDLTWSSKERKKQFADVGYIEANAGWWMRKTFAPAYSSQTNPRHIGNEPEPCGGQSVHSHRYYTRYYEITQEQYDAMIFKPKLEEIHRPARFYNFDGYAEQIQASRDGLGWIEKESNFHDTTTYMYFVV